MENKSITPEEIVKELSDNKAFGFTSGISNDEAIHKAVEQIKAYARRMCDEQKEISYSNSYCTIYKYKPSVDKDSVIKVPYPKELQ